MQRIVLLLCAGLFSACAAFSSRDIVSSWEGHDVDDLILDWGPPADDYKAKDGRRTLTFSHSRVITGTQYYCDVTFAVDADDVIQSGSVDGNLGGCNRFFAIKRSAE